MRYADAFLVIDTVCVGPSEDGIGIGNGYVFYFFIEFFFDFWNAFGF